MTLLISSEHLLNTDALLLFDAPKAHNKVNQHQLIRNSVEQLPDMQKKVISCIDILGFSYNECCQALEISEVQLKNYLKIARQSLLNQLACI